MYVWEVIELNGMGDHTVIGVYKTQEHAEEVRKTMMFFLQEPYTSYYVNDRRKEFEHND